MFWSLLLTLDTGAVCSSRASANSPGWIMQGRSSWVTHQSVLCHWYLRQMDRWWEKGPRAFYFAWCSPILSRPRILFYKRVSGFESSIECCSHLADVFHLFFVLCVLHVLSVLSVLHFFPAFPTNSMSSHPGWQHGRTCRSPSEWIVGSKSVYIEFPDCRFISLAGKERVSKPF